MPLAIAGPGPVSDLGSLCRALDAPNLAEVVGQVAERAQAEHWSYEEFLVACLERAVAERRSNEGEDDNPLAPETVDLRRPPGVPLFFPSCGHRLAAGA